MIIGAFIAREIGEIVQGSVIEVSGGPGVAIPYKVLREATEQEWIDEQIADGCWGAIEQLRFKYNPRALFYYDVSVD